jgi:hypothetical protein
MNSTSTTALVKCHYDYVEMIKCLTIKTLPFMIKILPFYKLSTELLVYFVCGRLCSVHRIATFIRRSVHDWKLWRGIFFLNMDGRIAYGLLLLARRYYNCSP